MSFRKFLAAFLIPGLVIGATAAYGDTEITPSMTVQERYDSNVFFIRGSNTDDFVTTVTPKVLVANEGNWGDGSVYGTMFSNTYIKNPGLNYVGGSVGVQADVSPFVQRFIPRADLSVTDAFRYTPESPAFLSPEKQGPIPLTFIRGIQASRANAYTNSGMLKGSYAITPNVSIVGNYTNTYFKYGSIITNPGFGSFFTTQYQNVSTGPQWAITARDTLSLTYQYLHTHFDRGGFGSGFETHGLIGGWTRELTEQLTASASGGATRFPSGNVQYLADAFLEWKYEESRVRLHYSRSVLPSFFIAGLPLVSQVVNIVGSYQMTNNVVLAAGATYALNESVPNPILKFESYGANASMSYTVNRYFVATLQYLHSGFTNHFRSNGYSFSRDAVSVMLTATWN